MRTGDQDFLRGLAELARAVRRALDPLPAGVPSAVLASEAAYDLNRGGDRSRRAAPGAGHAGGTGSAVSSDPDAAAGSRIVALVELARDGDVDAFGALYDHYQALVYRFVYYRVGSVALAEDLTSETFLRALRSIASFQWQGRDFGAWLMTIARNLTLDHFKAGRTRWELPTEDMSAHDRATDGPEGAVLDAVTHDALLAALRELPTEQRECLVMRFLQGLSVAETAQVLGRSQGAVKQLQLRAVRHLAKLVPGDLR